MKFRGLLLALIVLAALVGVLYWSNRRSSAKTSEAVSSAPPKILAINQADIVKLEIKKKDGDVVLAREDSGPWSITAPKTFPADANAVSSLLSTVSSLDAERVVDEKASDLKTYGLAQPASEVVVTEKDNKSQRLLIGDDTPTGGAAYAGLAGDPRVFTIAGYHKSTLERGLGDLRDKRLLTVDEDRISRLELTTGKSDIEFGRDKEHWQILKPKPLRADGNEVENLVRNLINARIDLNNPGSAASSFSKGEAVGTAKVTAEGGSQELELRKIGKEYYAKSTVTDAAYKVPDAIAKEFDKSVDDFRNKNLFDFGYTDPGKIEFHDATKTYFLTHGGSDWWGPDGKKMDTASTYSFLDKLRELKADKFVDSGFGVSVIDITLTSQDGKQVEKVHLSKAGAYYIARRENDPSLYQMDAKSVEDLEKAAAEMKPAAAK